MCYMYYHSSTDTEEYGSLDTRVDMLIEGICIVEVASEVHSSSETKVVEERDEKDPVPCQCRTGKRGDEAEDSPTDDHVQC